MVSHSLAHIRSILFKFLRIQEPKQVDPVRRHDNDGLEISLAEQCRGVEAVGRTELKPSTIYPRQLSSNSVN